MRVVHDRCCGLDVHKKSVVACVITPEAQHTKTFGTTTGQLLALADWLQTHHVSHVAMESTGVYWKPIYNLLEDAFSVYVVNAHHIKAVPGRKTDVKDAEWIADLLRHGLLQPSFIPDRPQRELRELVRYRRSLVQERSREANRLAKVLEGANIKLGSVATDILGASGRLMLRALAAGEQDPQVLAQMARGRLRGKLAELQAALSGVMGSHQRFLLGVQLRHLEALEEEIDNLDAEVARRVEEHAEVVRGRRHDSGYWSPDGGGDRGGDGDGHGSLPDSGSLGVVVGCVSWQQPQSADRSRRSPTKKGNPSLRSALVEAARSAARTQTYLGAQYRRLARRIGANRAAMAVAHSMAVMLHRIIKTKQPFVDLGSDYFVARDKSAAIGRAVRQLERLGHKVSLEAA